LEKSGKGDHAAKQFALMNNWKIISNRLYQNLKSYPME